MVAAIHISANLPEPGHKQRRETPEQQFMEVLVIAISIVFFALCFAYAKACDNF